MNVVLSVTYEVAHGIKRDAVKNGKSIGQIVLEVLEKSMNKLESK